MGRWIDRLRRPTADNTANEFINQVIGNKADALAAGAVTETDTIVAYIKQLVTGQITVDELMDVPAKDNVLNVQVNEVVGNKTDTTAAGAVTETDTLVGYVKQLVSAAIVEAAASVADQVDLDAILADTITIGDATLPVAPVAGSLARFLASGGTALGTQLPDSFSLLDMTRGKKVTRVAADVFDGTQIPLFTVAGGRVLILGIVGEVSAFAIDAGASNASLVSNPTVGTDMAMCAVLDINADEVGTIYSITGTVTDALSGGSGGGAMFADRGIVVPEGTIDILTVADVGTGGALGAFDIWWLPLDTGATLVST